MASEITIPGMFLTGDHASLPAADAVGKGSLYACSTHTKVYQTDGSSWSDWFDPTSLTGGSGAMTLLDSSVLASPAASFDFTSISGSYNHLRVILMGRSATSAKSEQPYIQFNNDTGSSYVRELVGASATTVAGAASGSPSAPGAASVLPFLPAATATGSVAGMLTVDIPCYAQTTFHKVAVATGGMADTTTLGENRMHDIAIRWASTSAITRVTILLSSGANFATGSAAYLYGIL